MNRQLAAIRKISKQHSRRTMLATSVGIGGLALPSFLQLQRASLQANAPNRRRAKACIIIYAWGGMSHHETWDPKPDAPAEFRGEFDPIATVTPGIQIGEHMPQLARQTDKLAIIRSIHHDDSAHGRGMYWNLTGHKPPRVGNIPPMRNDWPSLPAVVSKFSKPIPGVPTACALPDGG